MRWSLTDRRTKWIRESVRRAIVVGAVLAVALFVAQAVCMPTWGWGALALGLVGVAATDTLKVKLLKAWTDTEGKEHKPEDGPLELPTEKAKAVIELGYGAEVADAKTVEEELATAGERLKAVAKQAILEGFQEAAKGFEVEGKRIKVGKDRRTDDPYCGFANDREVYKAIYRAGCKMGVDERLLVAQAQAKEAGDGLPDVMTKQELTSGEAGAFAAPVALSNRIFERVAGRLDILSLCDRIVMEGFGGVRIAAIKDADRYAAAARHGGVVVYNVAEGAAITASAQLWREILLIPHKKGALVPATFEYLASVANAGQRINNSMADAIVDEVSEDLMFGSGVGKCLGAFASDACLEVAKETDQDADTIQPENIVKMEAFVSEVRTAQWWYNPECHAQLTLMVITVGTSGYPVMLPAGGFSGEPYQTLRGRVATKTDHCEALGDAGDIVLGDFSQYFALTVGSVRSDLSVHLYFDQDKTAFRGIFAVGGQPAWDTTLRPRKGAAATRLAPFIKLAARA